MTPRLLTPADVPACFALSAEIGWNQTARDWMRLLTLAPDGCFALDADGGLQATATVVCHGAELAWIGMVLVRPAYRGRGFARTLLRHALDHAAGKGIACVKLDATELGEPVYWKLGFQAEIGVERWVRDPQPVGELEPLAEERPSIDLALDRQAFGADRSTLLWLLELEGASVAEDGSYCLCRPGREAAFVGPCVSADPKTAQRLFQGLAGEIPDAVYWDRFAGNAAREPDFGFRRARHLMRMYKGKRLSGDPALQLALAGFELG